MTQQTSAPVSRVQRVLSYIIAALVIVALACIAAILIGTAVGEFARQGSGEGLWPAVFLFPLIAFPAALVLILALILVVGRQRRRAAQTARPKGQR